MKGATEPRERVQQLNRAIAEHVDSLATPTLVIDLDAVEHNVAAMLARTGSPQRWRPHVKTVKQSTIVGALLDAGVFRFKAATPAEVALVLEAADERALPQPVEVLLAYPAAPPQLAVMLDLRQQYHEARIGLLADAPEHIEDLIRGIGSPLDTPAFDLWLDVDIGMHRTGTSPERWREATWPKCQWLHPTGVHGYDGHIRWSEREQAHAGYDQLVELVAALPFEVEQVVTSGTHSYAHALDHAPLRAGSWTHQVSPGTIVLSDRFSAEAAADLGLRQAAFVLSRVIAHPGDDRITLDAGSKAMAPDCPAPSGGILGEPRFVPLKASEEHRPVRVDSGQRPPRGSLVWLVPDHVCTTVNMHAEALYVRTDTVVGSAPVRARGHRPWIALAGLLLAVMPNAACQPITTGVDVQLLLPPAPDDADLQRTNNVSLVLEPDGFTDSVSANGLDFVLSFEVPPDATSRTMSVFLAENDTLLAWGQTPPFTYGGATNGLSLLLGQPGRLTALDLDFATPDADALVAPISNRGMLVQSSDGATVFLDLYQYTLQAASTLEEPPGATDGRLVGAADGRVLRVAWNDGVSAFRFDPNTDTWQALELSGALDARPGAASWWSEEDQTLRIFGGGEQTTVLELPAVGDDPRELSPAENLVLDGPRAGATAAVLGSTPLVIGGDDPALPLVWNPAAGTGAGPMLAWTGLACATRSESPLQMLCVGGLREGTESADGLQIDLRDGTLEVEELTDLLPQAMAAPLLLPDTDALVAQGAGRLFHIARGDLAVTEPAGITLRADGGSTAPLPSGATLIVGGRDVDGVALPRWTVFSPTVVP
ncbi:MAG: alanine racemase [Myxococcota bacterium]